MTTDAEVRGHLLGLFYELRHQNGGWVPTSDMTGLEGVNGHMIGAACQHLAEAGLIDWKPLGDEGPIVGMARIRGHGVDVFEHKAVSGLNIKLKGDERQFVGASTKGVAGTFAEPSFKGAAARGEAGTFVPDNQSWEVAAEIAVRQSRRNPALLALNGTEVFPPGPVQSGEPARQSTLASAQIQSERLAITPTEYPSDPIDGIVIVHNFISIDFAGETFRKFNANIAELLTELRRSNEISGEVREKLAFEIEAGLTILKSPKPDPKLIDLLLKRPLTYVVDKAAGTIISTLAATALMALLKMTGLL